MNASKNEELHAWLDFKRQSGLNPHEAADASEKELPENTEILPGLDTVKYGVIVGWDSDLKLVKSNMDTLYWRPVYSKGEWHGNLPYVAVIILGALLGVLKFGFWLVRVLALAFLPKHLYQRMFYFAIFYDILAGRAHPD